jgi:transcriptional regulator with GAF, ATPase, and Fis domain
LEEFLGIKKTQNKKSSDNSLFRNLLKVGKNLLAESSLDNLLSLAIDNTIEMSGAERGMIILFGESGEILFQTARNLQQQDVENPKFEISRTIIEMVRKKKIPIYLEDAFEDDRFKKSDSVQQLRILSIICLPLIKKNQVFGVIYLDNRTLKGVFSTDIYELVKELGELISLAAYQALQRKRLFNRISTLEKELRDKYRFENIIGHHPKIVEVLKLVSQIADSNATVLIQGESGTGKELIARAIHYNSSRREKPFVPVNCGALPENLLESELFGHVHGAFTGAVNERIGWFEKANQGTMFLDEISEMSPSLQVKLLRILQTGEFSKVGSTQFQQCDVRIISATNKNLELQIKNGHFREDLFYRLDVVEIGLPPLRERNSDILLLIKHFIDYYNQECNKQIKDISPEAEAKLMAYHFPGNIRELENLIVRAITLAKGDLIEVQHLPARVSRKMVVENKNDYLKFSTLHEARKHGVEKIEKEYVIHCLQTTSGHISNAAKLAGMDVGNFYRLIKKYRIKPALYK